MRATLDAVAALPWADVLLVLALGQLLYTLVLTQLLVAAQRAMVARSLPWRASLVITLALFVLWVVVR